MSPDDDVRKARALRAGAVRVRGAAEALADRADALPRSLQRRLLKLQAGILRDGAADLDDKALALEPARGEA